MHQRASDGKGRGNSSIYQHILLLTSKMCLVQRDVFLEFKGKSGRFASAILFLIPLQSSYMYSIKKNERILICWTRGGKLIIVGGEWKIFSYGDLAA